MAPPALQTEQGMSAILEVARRIDLCLCQDDSIVELDLDWDRTVFDEPPQRCDREFLFFEMPMFLLGSPSQRALMLNVLVYLKDTPEDFARYLGRYAAIMARIGMTVVERGIVLQQLSNVGFGKEYALPHDDLWVFRSFPPDDISPFDLADKLELLSRCVKADDKPMVVSLIALTIETLLHMEPDERGSLRNTLERLQSIAPMSFKQMPLTSLLAAYKLLFPMEEWTVNHMYYRRQRASALS
jgi:hypothetical protein